MQSWHYSCVTRGTAVSTDVGKEASGVHARHEGQAAAANAQGSEGGQSLQPTGIQDRAPATEGPADDPPGT